VDPCFHLSPPTPTPTAACPPNRPLCFNGRENSIFFPTKRFFPDDRHVCRLQRCSDWNPKLSSTKIAEPFFFFSHSSFLWDKKLQSPLYFFHVTRAPPVRFILHIFLSQRSVSQEPIFCSQISRSSSSSTQPRPFLHTILVGGSFQCDQYFLRCHGICMTRQPGGYSRCNRGC